jgi:hypothetical protein
MKIAILGRGASLKDYPGDCDMTIGVSTLVKADKHVLIDTLHDYIHCKTDGRLEIEYYEENVKEVFCSDVAMFKKATRDGKIAHKLFFMMLVADIRQECRGFLPQWEYWLKKDLVVPISFVGSLSACCIAYYLGATEIHLWGVDMGEDYFKPDVEGSDWIRDHVLTHFKILKYEFEEIGIKVKVGNNKSILSSIFETIQ